VTNKLYKFIKLQLLSSKLLTIRCPLLPSSGRFIFTVGCRHGEHTVIDLRKLVHRSVFFLAYIASLIHCWSILLLSLSITLARSQSMTWLREMAWFFQSMTWLRAITWSVTADLFCAVAVDLLVLCTVVHSGHLPVNTLHFFPINAFLGKEWSQFMGRWPLCTTVALHV